MPWAQDPSETANSDLYHSLHPITQADHARTVSSCASQLSQFRLCVNRQPIHLEDHVAAANCADIFHQLRSCSERVVLEAGRVSGSKTPVEQARFQLQGSFA